MSRSYEGLAGLTAREHTPTKNFGAEVDVLDLADTRWHNFAAEQSQAQIFHHPAWTQLMADCYGYRPFVLAVRDADGHIRAGIPMVEVPGLLRGRRWVALPFSDYCAPLTCSPDAQSTLINSLIQAYEAGNAPPIELRCELPPHTAVKSHSEHVLHTLTLDPDSSSVAGRFHSTHRRNIKVAQTRGVRIERGNEREHVEAFYRLHLETRRRQGVPIQPWRFFDLLWSKLIANGLGFVLLAYKDDECLAGAVFLHWQRTLTYKYGASAADGLNLRPNNLLFWTAIQWGCENGYSLFDMGKTDLANTGLRAFKSGWGADEMPLVYSSLPPQSSSSVTDRLMPIMQSAIQHSPAWVCRVTGELVYRYFG